MSMMKWFIEGGASSYAMVTTRLLYVGVLRQ